MNLERPKHIITFPLIYSLHYFNIIKCFTTTMILIKKLCKTGSTFYRRYLNLIIKYSVRLKIIQKQSKKRDNDQESIQSSTTSDPGYHMGN